jgi:limonene-1,2-epoxide hydrolase
VANPTEIITNFCAAWANLDTDELMGYFAEDGVYYNMPAEPWEGAAAVRAGIDSFLKSWSKTDWELLNIAANGNIVIAERIDRTDVGDKHVDLPCVGVFELDDDGKIKVWRDYFDMGTFVKAMS